MLDEIRGVALWAFKPDIFTTWLKVAVRCVSAPLSAKFNKRLSYFVPNYSGLIETGTNLINLITQLLYWDEWRTQSPHCEDAASGYLRWGFMQRSKLRGGLCWIVCWGCSSVVTLLRVLLLVKWSQMMLMGHLIRRSRGRPRTCQGDYVIWFGNSSSFPRWSWKSFFIQFFD